MARILRQISFFAGPEIAGSQDMRAFLSATTVWQSLVCRRRLSPAAKCILTLVQLSA
jgi:hypothetical protein